MAKVTYIQPEGEAQVTDCFEPITVMHLGVANLVIGIDALCGGVRSCGTCHVYIDDAWTETVGGPGPEEKEMLDALAEDITVKPTSRLSCQIHITEKLDGLVVHVPEDQPGV